MQTNLINFRVTPADRFGSVVLAADETAAIAKFIADRTAPVYCRCHDEIADRHSAVIGEMGYFTPPTPAGPFNVQRLREIVCCGSYAWQTVSTVELGLAA